MSCMWSDGYQSLGGMMKLLESALEVIKKLWRGDLVVVCDANGFKAPAISTWAFQRPVAVLVLDERHGDRRGTGQQGWPLSAACNTFLYNTFQDVELAIKEPISFPEMDLFEVTRMQNTSSSSRVILRHA